MIRRFANIITEKQGCGGTYSLHRLDVWNRLFYPSTAAADAAAKRRLARKYTLGTDLPRLPAPAMRFQLLPIAPPCAATRLVLFAQRTTPRSSGEEDRIICSDAAGRTFLYGAGSDCLLTMPCFKSGKAFKPTTVYPARPGEPHDDLYVLSPEVSSFDALRFHSSPPSKPFFKTDADYWYCQPLPPPPFTGKVSSYAVAGKTICVSAGCGGTYYFDTVECEWRQAAGDWALPFVGGAEYLPDLKLWLGFAAGSSHNLCAWDLSALDGQPPTLLHCGPDPNTPEDCAATSLRLLNLGSGRFCAAKVFRVVGSATEEEDKFAVFTGMELVTCSSGENRIERIVQHKSLLYDMFISDKIRWVL